MLVAHNAVFDWQMIAREYARARSEAPVKQRLCTIALSKELRLPLPNHKLESLAAHFGVVQRRAHHALDDARVLAEAFRPSLRAAAAGGVRLPLHECLPLTEWTDRPRTGSRRAPAATGRPAGARPASGPRARTPTRGGTSRASGSSRACGWRSPGTPSVERDLLEDRATEAGLHVAGSLSRLTSLLVTNDPDSGTSKVSRPGSTAPRSSTRPAFGQLLGDVEPAPED
ncbi:hypothetical protein GCM10023238_02080 [Streptomyces heliomycini]